MRGGSLDQSSYRVQKQSGGLELKGQMSAAANRNKFLPTKAGTKGSGWSRVTFRKRGAGRRRERQRETKKVRVSRSLSLFLHFFSFTGQRLV